MTIGTHHYTLSKDEYQYLGTIGWSREGIGWYAVDSTSCTITASFGDGAGSTESTVSTNKGGVTYVVLLLRQCQQCEAELLGQWLRS